MTSDKTRYRRRGISNAFTVTPQRVTYATEAMVPFLQNKNTPYTVSYSIEDKDGVHGAATSFVAISHEKGSGPDVPTDDIQITLVQPDKPLPGVFTVADPDGIPDSGDETKVQFSQGNLASHIEYGEWGIFPNQYDCMNTVGSNNDIVSWIDPTSVLQKYRPASHYRPVFVMHLCFY